MAHQDGHEVSFWAKTGRENDYLPLECHLDDVAAVAGRLFDVALTAAQRAWLADQIGATTPETRALVLFLAAAHDCGKLSPTFQGLVPELADRVLEPSLTLVPDDGLGPALRHDGISGVLLTEWLVTRGGSRELAERLAATVSGHHGTPRLAREIRQQGRRELRRAAAWHPHQNALLNRLADAHDLPDVTRFAPPGDAAVLALAGLVCVADWVASDPSRFPVTAGPREASVDLAGGAVADDAWAPRPVPSDVGFLETFGFLPRAAQQAMIELLDDEQGPSLMILEDRTGSGKTEAALWAALRAIQGGARGLYVGLPTRATADQFHERAQRFLGALWADGAQHQVRLLHGGAHLRDDDPVPAGVDDGADDGAARQWFAAPRRGLLSPYAVGTIDQALLAVLHARHYPVRLWGLQGKVVILDEVHAYDVYTGRLMERLIGWLAALDCTVVLLSATLPARRRAALCAAYEEGARMPSDGSAGPVSPVEATRYPRLTRAGHRGHVVVGIADDRPGRVVSLEHLGVVDDEADVTEHLLSQVVDGGCVAMVCSTVAVAQARYESVRSQIDADIEVVLLHARMRPLERGPIEQRLIALLGPRCVGERRPSRFVVIATQVIEQSLDLDFDVILTDLAPVDLLVQRAGRVHRHAGRPRPPMHDTPRLIVLDTPGRDAVRDLPRGAGAIYVKAILARTRLLLRDRAALVEPEELDELIEGVYGDEVPAAATAEEHRTVERWDAAAASDARELGGWALDAAIGAPHAEKRPWEVHDTPRSDADAPGAHGRNSAATRWTERPSVSVVILAADEARLVNDASGGRAVRQLLLRAVDISAPAVVRALLAEQDRFRPDAWKRLGGLRHHFLVVLDGGGRAVHDDGHPALPVKWDPVLGVCIQGVTRVQPR